MNLEDYHEMDEDFSPTVDRYALVVIPTPAFLEWLHTVPGNEDIFMAQLTIEGTVYLVPETEEEPESIIQRHYQFIFEEELLAWVIDDSYWPKDRSFDNFKRFFEVKLASMVFDLQGEASWHDTISMEETMRVANVSDFHIREHLHDGETTLEGERKGEFIIALANHISKITDENQLEGVVTDFDELPEFVKEWFREAMGAWSTGDS